MLEILTLSLALQGALLIAVRLVTGHGRWPVDVLAPANIETTRKALQWAFIVYALLWLLVCMAHVAASTMHTSFYLEFGPWRASWQALLMLQSAAMFQTVLCALAWCATTLCAMFQAAIVHARVNGSI
jgi:uncharacterized integral membrane protein